MTTIMTPCVHSDTVPVELEATHELVAYLCTNCLVELPLAEPEPVPEVPQGPSGFPHVVYEVTVWADEYGDKTEVRTAVGDTRNMPAEANLISSQIAGSKDHSIMLDIDVEAHLVPSSTPGHSHLYIDVALSWRRYRRLLRALKRAGVIEPGYYKASRLRRHTALRLPGVVKEG
jgi:hypothetical protein